MRQQAAHDAGRAADHENRTAIARVIRLKRAMGDRERAIVADRAAVVAQAEAFDDREVFERQAAAAVDDKDALGETSA